MQIVERTVSILSDLRAAKQAEISALMTRVLNIHPIDVGSFFFSDPQVGKQAYETSALTAVLRHVGELFYTVMYFATASSRRLHFFSDCIFSVLNMV